MAEIHLTSLRRIPSYGGGGGPDVPGEIRAFFRERQTRGGTISTLELSVGVDTVQIWPADDEQVRGLIASLTRLLPPAGGDTD